MVWGEICGDQKTDLVIINGNLTARCYIDEILRPVVPPDLHRHPRTLFQQDNTTPHTARITSDFLNTNNINVNLLQWPARSPDLSPIEHLWDQLGQRPIYGGAFNVNIESRQVGVPSRDVQASLASSAKRCPRCQTLLCCIVVTGGPPDKRIWIRDDYCDATSHGCIWIHKKHCSQPAPTSCVTSAQTSSGVTTAQTTSGETPAQTTSAVTSAPTSSPAQTSSGVTTAQTPSGVTSAQTTSGGTPVQTTSAERSDTTSSSSNGQTTDVQIVENICPDCEQKSGICVWVPSDGPPVEEVNKLIKSLLLEKKTLSSYKHTKTSAKDDRPSAKAIGQTGVVLCVLGFVGVVLLDAGRLVNWLEMRRRRRLSFRP
ncbi:uncharacterized protein LOC124280992 [Haliotis rubra]|uniref:uncharacterized protein LOC124280992 n=1 Tax=Haliotis rubra TaxID=36100 RepID=UPI001EE5DCB9|nr:uncharacterized protein LOC124280992 [Haliotis rubra]